MDSKIATYAKGIFAFPKKPIFRMMKNYSYIKESLGTRRNLYDLAAKPTIQLFV
jgi:hypothetical protein